MKLLHLLIAGALALVSVPASAQQARVVPSCSGVTLRAGDSANLMVDAGGNLCIASVPGGAGQAVTGSQEQDVRASNTLNVATANATIVYAINGQATVGFTFTGLTASGATLTYEQSIDGGTTWTGINAINRGTGVPEATRTTDGQIALSATGRTNIRVRVSATGTGTITVASNISVREGILSLGSPLPPGTNAIGSITNPFALESTQQGVASSNAAINAATGAQSDAASVSGANTSIIGALRAIRDRVLSILQVRIYGNDGATTRESALTTSGAFMPPPAASGKATPWFASLSATTSTQLLAANTNRLAYSLQCSGTAPVAVSETGATLTTATPAAGSNITLVIPNGATPYFIPVIASLTAITAYTGTGQSCWGAEYLR